MLLNSVVGEDSWESLGQQGDQSSPSQRRSVLGVHWKVWCRSWNSNNLATWSNELTHLKRPWCWERLKAEGEGDDRGWNSWMASLTQWTLVWVDSDSWWWTGRPGMLQSMGSQRVKHEWATELNWTDWVGDNNITLRGCMVFQKGSVAQMQVARKKTVALDFWQMKQIGRCLLIEWKKSQNIHWKIRIGWKSSLMNRQCTNNVLRILWESKHCYIY